MKQLVRRSTVLVPVAVLLLISFACQQTSTPSQTTAPAPSATAAPTTPAVPTPKPAEFKVSDLSVEPAEVGPGEQATVKARISNTGESAGNYSAVLNLDGQKVDAKDVAIERGATQTVTFAVSRDAPGKYTLGLGSETKAFTVFETRQYLLRRDNGNSSQSSGLYDPRGQWVKLSPPAKPFKISAVLVRGYRRDFPNPDQKTYTIKIWDSTFAKQLYSADYPYTKFSTTATMVTHPINPPLVVNDDFYIDFISHSQAPPVNEPPKVIIYVYVDYTVAESGFSGYSWAGTIDSAYTASQIKQNPNLEYSSWIIEAQGTAKSVDLPPTLTPRPMPSPTPTRTAAATPPSPATKPATPAPPPPGFSSYSNASAGFIISYPNAWEKKEGYMGSEVAFVSPRTGPSDTFAAAINVNVAPLDPQTPTLAEVTKAVVDKLKTVITDFNLVSSTPVTIGGLQAQKLVFTETQGQFTLKLMQVYAIKGQKGYVITCTAEAGAYSSFENTIQQMLDSFQIT